MRKIYRPFWFLLCAITLLSCDISRRTEQGKITPAVVPAPKIVQAADVENAQVREEAQDDGVFAPDFTLDSLTNESITLSAYRQKENVLLCFWTTWCPYCRKELKHLNEQYDSLTQQGIRVIPINMGEAEYKVRNFLESNRITLNVFLDKDTKVADAYDVRGVPTYLIINKSGKITYRGHTLPGRYQEYLK